MKIFFVVLAALLPAVAYSIGEAGSTEWPKGATIEVQLSLSATGGTNGPVKVSGDPAAGQQAVVPEERATSAARGCAAGQEGTIVEQIISGLSL